MHWGRPTIAGTVLQLLHERGPQDLDALGRTRIDLDRDLVRHAGKVLETSATSDTIHAALSDVVRQTLRMEILERRPALTLADLSAMRGHGFADGQQARYPG